MSFIYYASASCLDVHWFCEQGRAQAQMYQRTVHEWEKRQHRLQMEYGELVSRVEYLSDEVG
jgi:hypothetical protein